MTIVDYVGKYRQQIQANEYKYDKDEAANKEYP